MIITCKLLIIMSIFSLLGNEEEKAVNEPVAVKTVNNLSGFRMSCSHMRYPQCYSFSLYQRQEDVFFSASCDIEKKGKRITIENKKVSQEFWNEFISLAEELKICNLPEYKRVKSPVKVRDKTEYYTTLSFGKSYRDVNLHSNTRIILEDFFFKKAQEENDAQSSE